MTTIFSVKCPHCKTINVLMHDSMKREEVQIAYCDDEVGGCGVAFAVKSRIEIESTVYELKQAAGVSNA